MNRLKNFLKKFLPPPVNAFNREMGALDQRLLELERQLQEQNRQILAPVNAFSQEMGALGQRLLELERQLQEQNRQISELDKKLAYLPEISGKLRQMEQISKRAIPQPRLSYFELGIVDHCNLNCKGCSHFSCIAEERFISADIIKKDLNRMSELLHGSMTRVGVMGGEPLLHPNLPEILTATRAAFPKTFIQLVTNGLLLLKMSEGFWECCRENSIVISPTRYPINLDYDRIQKVAAKHDVQLQFYGDFSKVQKTSNKYTFDLKGRQNPISSFQECFHVDCPNLVEGRLYPCPITAGIQIFNKKFGTDLELEPGDYLDIYEAQSADEVYRFLATPKSFCRYCMISKRIFGLPWGQTTQEMSEWLPD